MAISPISISRTSLGLRANFVVDSLRSNQLDLFLAQTRIATGRSFVTPSEDPVGAARVADLSRELFRQAQFVSNLQFADNTLAASDSAITEINDLLIQAQAIASQNVSNLTDADERAAEAELIAGIRHQLVLVGNRQLNGRYLFAGRDTLDTPFIDALGGVAYVGDSGELVTRISDDVSSPFSIPGNVLFGALTSRVSGTVDLTPSLTPSMRMDDLAGAAGRGIQLGMVVFNEVGGAGVFTADLRSADTIGDIVTLINDAAASAGANLTASLSATGLTITPAGAAVSIGDTGGGAIAAGLGILTNEPTSDPIAGDALGPRLTRLTPVEALVGGNGIDLDGGLIITNGGESVTVDLSTAETVQDIINTINSTGLFIFAQINEAGSGIEIVNQVSGSLLTIGENGGTTAADLGIRTFDLDTPLDSLNSGAGMTRADGTTDLRISAKNGATIDVNLDGAVTIGDVIDLLNDAAAEAGVAVTASLAPVGNGILLADATGGTGALSVAALNESAAATDLGLLGPLPDEATELVGADTNPTRTESILDALIDLERALRADDTPGITGAGQRLEQLMEEVTRIHGIIGARSQAMRARLLQTQDAAATTEIFLSQIQDLDYAEAVTQMQTAQTRLQASLQTSAVVLNLSLLDFLR